MTQAGTAQPAPSQRLPSGRSTHFLCRSSPLGRGAFPGHTVGHPGCSRFPQSREAAPRPSQPLAWASVPVPSGGTPRRRVPPDLVTLRLALPGNRLPAAPSGRARPCAQRQSRGSRHLPLTRLRAVGFGVVIVPVGVWPSWRSALVLRWVQPVFTPLFAIWVPSLVTCLFRSFAHYF